MNDELKGKTALVTGSSRGIGRAAAVALAQAGADVAVNYLANEVEAKKTCAEIEQTGRRSVAIRADVSLSDQVSRLINEVRESHPGQQCWDWATQAVLRGHRRGLGPGAED